MFFSRLDFRLSHLLSCLYYSTYSVACQDVFYNFLIFFTGCGGVAPPSLHLLLYHNYNKSQVLFSINIYTNFGIFMHKKFFAKNSWQIAGRCGILESALSRWSARRHKNRAFPPYSIISILSLTVFNISHIKALSPLVSAFSSFSSPFVFSLL